MDELTPITSPVALTSGPPELPGLIEASVCTMSKYADGPSPRATRLRPTPLMTPAVTLGSELPSMKPYGLPIAIAHSPTSRLSLSPSGATGRFAALTFNTARSFVSSVPIAVAG